MLDQGRIVQKGSHHELGFQEGMDKQMSQDLQGWYEKKACCGDRMRGALCGSAPLRLSGVILT